MIDRLVGTSDQLVENTATFPDQTPLVRLQTWMTLEVASKPMGLVDPSTSASVGASGVAEPNMTKPITVTTMTAATVTTVGSSGTKVDTKDKWRQLWEGSGLNGAGLARTCATLVHRQPDDDEKERGCLLLRHLPSRSLLMLCLSEDLHAILVKLKLQSFYAPPETVLVLTALRLESAIGENWPRGISEWDRGREHVNESMQALVSIAGIPRLSATKRISNRFHLDGRMIHQIVQSFENGGRETNSLHNWLEAVLQIIELAISTHLGPAQLAFLRKLPFPPPQQPPPPAPPPTLSAKKEQPAANGKTMGDQVCVKSVPATPATRITDVESDATTKMNPSAKYDQGVNVKTEDRMDGLDGLWGDVVRMNAILKWSASDSLSVHCEHIRLSIYDFHRAITPTQSLRARFIESLRYINNNSNPIVSEVKNSLMVRIAGEVVKFLETDLPMRALKGDLTSLNSDLDLPAHFVPGAAPGEYFTAGFFQHMLHRIERRVGVSTYAQYSKEQALREMWATRLLQIAQTVGITPIDHQPPIAQPAQPAQPTQLARPQGSESTTGPNRNGRKRSNSSNNRKRKTNDFMALMDEVDEKGESEHASMLKRLRSNDNARESRATKRRLAKMDHENSQPSKGDAEKQTVGMSETIVGRADELGRCFVAQTLSLQSLTDKWAKEENEPWMFSMWNKRSDVLVMLQADDVWRTSGPQWGPLPKFPDLDIGTCLSEHLDIAPKRDTITGKPILNGASDSLSYTDREMYNADRSVNKNLLKKLDLTYEAMLGSHEITTHRDILAFSGLRGYFIDIWRTTVLNGRRAITGPGLAFICSALVYCMDSKDVADHADYYSLNQIMWHYVDRSPAPGQVAGAVCLHKGTTLAKAHPLLQNNNEEPRLDSHGFGPRLLLWLVKSQHLSSPNSAASQNNSQDQSSGANTTVTDGYGMGRIAPVKNRLRWMECLVLIHLITGVYLQPILVSANTRMNNQKLTVIDLLRMTMPVVNHNETMKSLIHDWTSRGIVYDSLDTNYVHDPIDYPTARKAHELWKLSKADIKSLTVSVQTTLVRLIGCEHPNRKLISDWLIASRPLILQEATLAPNEKLQTSYVAAFLSAAIEALRGAKFDKYMASIFSDVIHTSGAGGKRHKLIYMPNTNKNRQKTVKGDTQEEAQTRRTLVNHLVNVHKWRYRLKTIERAGDDAGLIPTDPNLTDVERKFLNVRLAQNLNNLSASIPHVAHINHFQPAPPQLQQQLMALAPRVLVGAPPTSVAAVAAASMTNVPIAKTDAVPHGAIAAASGGCAAMGGAMSGAWWSSHLGSTQRQLLTEEQAKMDARYLAEPILHHVSMRRHDAVACPPFASLDIAALVTRGTGQNGSNGNALCQVPVTSTIVPATNGTLAPALPLAANVLATQSQLDIPPHPAAPAALSGTRSMIACVPTSTSPSSFLN